MARRKFEIEFYTRSAEIAFKIYRDKLMQKGFTEDEATELLEEIYATVSNEYGN